MERPVGGKVRGRGRGGGGETVRWRRCGIRRDPGGERGRRGMVDSGEAR
jgi:hypothetical protein